MMKLTKQKAIKCEITGLGFKGVKGKADPKKQLDLEINAVNILI